MFRDSLTAALFYTRLGYPVFPCAVGEKKPLTPNGYKDAATDEEVVSEWFTRTPNANIGLVTNGLVVIDMDVGGCLSADPDEMHDLAGAPCQETPSGGRHYVFKQPAGRSYRNTVGKIATKVDTRADGGYIVVEPSRFDGGQYKWLTPLECSPDDLPEPPPWLVKRLDALAVTHAGYPESSVESVSSVSHRDIAGAIERTLPAEVGTRKRLLFHFARELWALYGTKDVPARQLKPHVSAWHRRALPNIRTKAFDESWTDFLYAWDSAKYPAGQEPISQMYEKALKLPCPECALGYDTPELRNLVALCRELQREAGKDPFYLACRVAGRLIGVDRNTANHWLGLTLQADEVVALVRKGSRGRASEYRYLPDL